MMFKSRTLIAGATLALLSAGAVWAQSTVPAATGAAPAAAAPTSPAPPAAMTEKPLTSKEMMAAFTKADANKDGKLDRVEAEGVPGLGARFEQVDADGDKMISKAEFEKALKQ
jgi:hypothetical protein